MKNSILVAVFVLVASASGNVDDSGPSIQDLAANLPSIDGFNASQIGAHVPTVEDAEKVFKEKCLKNSNMEAYDRAKMAQDEAKECVLSLVNVTVLQEEMETAKPTGDLDEVFKKYCRKSPQLRQCISNFTSAVEPCLDEAERESKHIVQNITDKLVEFICFKEGDRIALFIAEGGPECLQNNQEGIQLCVNTTLKRHIPNEVPSVENLPMLVMGTEECKDFRVLQQCVVDKLESCKEPTPANIVEAMFNFVYKVTPCGKLGVKQSATTEGLHGNGASATAYVLILSFLAVLTARLL